MALTQHESGTETISAVGTTWQVLNTTSPDLTAGVFQLVVDLTNLVAGDILEIRRKEKTTGTGDTLIVGWPWPASVGPFVPIHKEFRGPAEMLMAHGWDYEIRQTAGTARSFKWSIRKIA